MTNDHTALSSIAGPCALPPAKKRWSTPEIMNLETSETAGLGKTMDVCETADEGRAELCGS